MTSKDAQINVLQGKVAKLENENVVLHDNPELDGTDYAHPSWWRGNDAGVASVVRMLNDDLDSKEIHGVCGSNELQKLRKRILKIG